MAFTAGSGFDVFGLSCCFNCGLLILVSFDDCLCWLVLLLGLGCMFTLCGLDYVFYVWFVCVILFGVIA